MATAVAADDSRSAEDWARAAWEAAPFLVRWLIIVGWRVVLGLRLGPLHDPDHILGWPIVERDPEDVAVELSSRLLWARNAFSRWDDQLAWSTFVSYDTRLAKFVWLPVSLLHRPLVRYTLRRAASGERGAQ